LKVKLTGQGQGRGSG